MNVAAYIEQFPKKRITYAEYIAYVLYDDKYGYYMKEHQKIGKDGDFYTSSNVHPIFAKIFAKTFLQLLSEHDLPLQICEIGAGTGRFAQQVLQEIYELDERSYEKVRYYIVEESRHHRQCQSESLKQHENVTIYRDLIEMKKALPHFSGIIFSNELLDAFPVHVVEKKEDMLYEVYVTINEEGNLSEQFDQLSTERIKRWLQQYAPPLVNGQRIEVPLAMNDWLNEISTWLNDGFLFTVDYGYTKQEWTAPERRDGSLRGYYKHQLVTNPLLYPGEMDLTSHIHLDALTEFAETLGLKTVFQLKQRDFLLQEGILSYLQNNYDPNPFSETSRQNRAIRSFLLDDGLAHAFTVTLQKKERN